MQRVQSTKINVAAIHDVECARLRNKYVEHINIVKFSVADMDKTGDGATQIQQSVHLYRGLRRTEVRPREYGKTQVNRGGVWGVDGLLEIDTERLLRIKTTCD